MRTPASSDEKECLRSSTGVFFSNSQDALLHAWHDVISVANIFYTSNQSPKGKKEAHIYLSQTQLLL